MISNPILFGEPAETEALASLVDLLPTIATLAGADTDGAGLRGRDLSPVLARHADPGREALAAAPVDLSAIAEHPSPADSVQEAIHFTFDDHQAGTATREAPGQPNRVRAVRTASHKYATYVDPARQGRDRARAVRPRPRPRRGAQPRGPHERRGALERATGTRSTSCASGCGARWRAAGPRCVRAERGRLRAPRSYTRRVPLPPGPRAPASVNTARLAVRPLETLLGWHRRYGDAFTVRYLVFGTGVYVADPDAIREMFTGDQSDLHAGEANAPLSPVLGEHSVLVLDGAEHLRQRRLLLPPFQGSAVADWRAVIAEVAEAEVDRWAPGSELVMRERMRVLTFDVICRAVFGVAEPERVERLREALLAVVDSSSLIMFLEGLRMDLGRWSPWGRFMRRLEAADALIYEEIERRRHEPELEDRSDVLSLLLRARDADGEPMSDAELRDELMTMLAAGHETTATGLAWAFDLLLHNPATMARLRDELDGGGGPARGPPTSPPPGRGRRPAPSTRRRRAPRSDPGRRSPGTRARRAR